MFSKKLFILPFFVLVSCSKLDRIEPEGYTVKIEADTVVFAQIGDYGYAGMPEFYVSQMVKSWNPDFIVSAGDNNYYEGKMESIVNNVSQFYGEYIYNYDAPEEYKCNGRAFSDKVNRFFSSPGNHDANNRNKLTPYYNFFSLPGNESYYSFVWGSVTFYSLNSAAENYDVQKRWLDQEVKKCSTPFKIVFFHHPPYSTGAHGCNKDMQWDFYSLGIDVIFTGHDHVYNRIEKIGEEGLFYIVNGLGGKGTSPCNEVPLSPDLFNMVCYSDNYGAVKGFATQKQLVIEFYSIDSSETAVDRLEIIK